MNLGASAHHGHHGPALSARGIVRYGLSLLAVVFLLNALRLFRGHQSEDEAQIGRLLVREQEMEHEVKSLKSLVDTLDRKWKDAQAAQDHNDKFARGAAEQANSKLKVMVADLQESTTTATRLRDKVEAQQRQLDALQARLHEHGTQHDADINALKQSNAAASRAERQAREDDTAGGSLQGRAARASDGSGSGVAADLAAKGSDGLDHHERQQKLAGRDPKKIRVHHAGGALQGSAGGADGGVNDDPGRLTDAHAAVLAAKKAEHVEKMSLGSSVLRGGGVGGKEVGGSLDSGVRDVGGGAKLRDSSGGALDSNLGGDAGGLAAGSKLIDSGGDGGERSGQLASGVGIVSPHVGLGAARGGPRGGMNGEALLDAHSAVQSAESMSQRHEQGLVDGGVSGSMRVRRGAGSAVSPSGAAAAEALDLDRAFAADGARDLVRALGAEAHGSSSRSRASGEAVTGLDSPDPAVLRAAMVDAGKRHAAAAAKGSDLQFGGRRGEAHSQLDLGSVRDHHVGGGAGSLDRLAVASKKAAVGGGGNVSSGGETSGFSSADSAAGSDSVGSSGGDSGSIGISAQAAELGDAPPSDAAAGYSAMLNMRAAKQNRLQDESLQT